MKKILSVFIGFIISGAALADQCTGVLIRDTQISTGEVVAGGVSRYPLNYAERGNLLSVSINGTDLNFQTTPVYNDKWKKNAKMQMRTGLIDTGEFGAEIITIKESNKMSAIQLTIKNGDKERIISGSRCGEY
jgi:hypothetical protein